MKEYRLKQNPNSTSNIELIGYWNKGQPQPNGIACEQDGYLVKFVDDDSKRWIIPADILKNKYEEVGKADYTILTPEQRNHIRILLGEVNTLFIAKAVRKECSDQQAAELIQMFQAEVGEKYKSFEDKVKFIEDKISLFEKSMPQAKRGKSISKYWVLFIDAKTKAMSMRNMYNKPTETQKEIFMAITDEVSAATICNRYNNEIAFKK